MVIVNCDLWQIMLGNCFLYNRVYSTIKIMET